MCVACEPTVNFSLSPNSLQMKVGDITTINVIGQATNIEWASSNEDVATVFHGVVTAKAIGTTTITAKSGEIVVNAQVFVTGTDGATLRISPAFVALKKGETHQFQYGNTYGLDITWSSSAEDIVKVDQQGLVTALKPGNATITLSTPVESVTALVAVEHNWGEYSLVWSDEFNDSYYERVMSYILIELRIIVFDLVKIINAKL